MKTTFQAGEFEWFPEWAECVRGEHKMRRLTPEETEGLTSVFMCVKCGFKSALHIKGEEKINKLKGRWFAIEKTAWSHKTE